jgi:hypothetical protein
VVGASTQGCELALAGRRRGFDVTLVDEHPQSVRTMAFDAPYFYGNGLPAGLRNRVAVAESVLTSNGLLLACAEAEVDVRAGTVAWGAFQNAPNSLHIGTPKVGLVSDDGNEMLAYDHLVLATGSRDFVPSFRGWELPGVFGVEAGKKLLTAYNCYDGTRTLVLGTSPEAIDFVRSARARGIEIAGLVEPTDRFQASRADLDWLSEQGIGVELRTVIEGANGTAAIRSASLMATGGDGARRDIACDTICVAIGTLPNIELAAAMGCALVFAEHWGSWLPAVTGAHETTRPHVYWLSRFNQNTRQVDRILDHIQGRRTVTQSETLASRCEASPATYIKAWVRALLETGGRDVTICQCETVSRAELLDLRPPGYLKSSLRAPKTPVIAAHAGSIVDQDLVKRMTRVGMGHCQGKRCRDEAALLLSIVHDVDLARIKPASYRFPVRPVDLALIAAEDDTIDTRERWPHWLEPYVQED